MAAPIYQTIYLHPAAPLKPPVGAACNGCGVCCAMAPCPVGMLISRRRSGRCAALVWQDDTARYVCGALAAPAWSQRPGLGPVSRWMRAVAERSIGAGIGCDADIEVPPR